MCLNVFKCLSAYDTRAIDMHLMKGDLLTYLFIDKYLYVPDGPAQSALQLSIQAVQRDHPASKLCIESALDRHGSTARRQ